MTERVWQLRAMSVAELLDEAIQLYRHNVLTFVGIVALLQVPMTLLSAIATVIVQQQYLLFTILLTVANFLVANGLLTAALVRAIANRYMDETVSIGGAYRAVLGRFLPLLGVLIRLMLINGGLLLLILIPLAGPFFWFVAFVLVNIRLVFVIQAVVLEGTSGRGAIGRSRHLVVGHTWRTLGFCALILALSFLIANLPVHAITFGFGILDLPPAVYAVLSSITAALLNVIFLPIRVTGLTLFYYDLRIRGEGLDLELQAAALSDGIDLSPVRLVPVIAPSPAERASHHRERGELRQAVHALWPAIDQQPDDALLHVELGRTLHELGNHDAALREFWRAVELEPDQSEAHYRLGVVYRDQGEQDAAREAFQTYLRLESDPQAWAEAEAGLDLAFLLEP